jgi:hypothetical protein
MNIQITILPSADHSYIDHPWPSILLLLLLLLLSKPEPRSKSLLLLNTHNGWITYESRQE